MKTVLHWKQIGLAFVGLFVLAIVTLPLYLPPWMGFVIGGIYGVGVTAFFDLLHFE